MGFRDLTCRKMFAVTLCPMCIGRRLAAYGLHGKSRNLVTVFPCNASTYTNIGIMGITYGVLVTGYWALFCSDSLSLSLPLYLSVSVHIYIYIHTHIHMWPHMSIYIYISTHTSVCVYYMYIYII